MPEKDFMPFQPALSKDVNSLPDLPSLLATQTDHGAGLLVKLRALTIRASEKFICSGRRGFTNRLSQNKNTGAQLPPIPRILRQAIQRNQNSKWDGSLEKS